MLTLHLASGDISFVQSLETAFSKHSCKEIAKSAKSGPADATRFFFNDIRASSGIRREKEPPVKITHTFRVRCRNRREKFTDLPRGFLPADLCP
jgi:hypothetical protein